MYFSKVYSKVCDLPKVNCLSCSLRLTDSVSVFSLLGGTGALPHSGAHRELTKVEKVGCCHCCSPRGVKLYIFNILLQCAYFGQQFKTGASVTITENTPCQLCCCTWMFHFYVQQFCWLSIRYILRHHVRLILYQTWSHSPFFSLGSEWSVKRIETMCTCSTDNCLHLLSGKTSQLFSCC